MIEYPTITYFTLHLYHIVMLSELKLLFKIECPLSISLQSAYIFSQFTNTQTPRKLKNTKIKELKSGKEEIKAITKRGVSTWTSNT